MFLVEYQHFSKTEPKLNLKSGSASILEIESGSNDPIAYMLTIVLIDLINQSANFSEIPILLLNQISFGIFFGIIVGFVSVLILKKVNFMIDGLETIFVLAIALLTYAIPTVIGGNGYLATYLTGIIIGNSAILHKITLVHFFDGLTGLAQILIFFLLGLLSFPSQIPSILLPATLIFLWLTFIARPIATFLLVQSFSYSNSQKLLLSWSGIRGASAIVFSILVILKVPNLTYDIFHISFYICLISVALQGTLLPTIAHKLKMIDNRDNVLKTFTDYQEEEQLPLIQIFITPNHNWANQTINDLNLTDTLVLMIKRDEQILIPDGKTIILPGDQLVVSGTTFSEQPDFTLNEIHIDKNHPWHGKMIKELKLPTNTLIILIKRQDGTSITPNGDTLVQQGDILVLMCETFTQCNISFN